MAQGAPPRIACAGGGQRMVSTFQDHAAKTGVSKGKLRIRATDHGASMEIERVRCVVGRSTASRATMKVRMSSGQEKSAFCYEGDGAARENGWRAPSVWHRNEVASRFECPSGRYVTSSGRATMMPLCVGTLATYVARSSSRMTAFRVVDPCSSRRTPPSSR